MRPSRPVPRARRRPRLAALALAGTAFLDARAAVRGDDAPSPVGAGTATVTELVLGTPVAPVDPSDAERGIGLVSLDANAGTFAGLRSDGRVVVRSGEAERVMDPPADAGDYRVLAVAGDATPVVVTTHGRIVLLEAGGPRHLPLAVQRSAKPAAIPGSKDVVLGSENGSVRRLVRDGGEPRLEYVVARGDAPVGALAAAADRVVYARLDGVVLEAPFAGGAPRELARPRRAVRDLRVAGPTAYLLEGGALVTVGEAAPWAARTSDAPARAAASTGGCAARDARALAVSKDGVFAALLVGDAIEVRRLADGARVATSALARRSPTALAFDGDGRTLFVATASDARPWRVPLATRPVSAR